ncbi:Subtilase family protein [Paracoccus alcaliphilus]|uniref:Subtilase family protein n=1 Tax=Paracoccus alcaliphilus TaxID=34002 RepID=A0A1H8GZ11_9RHOB|nr:S8 family serine peptidase [Paracoccus alcaliphilus]WCR17458.1 S8 family serine peptidase [Paracoccus alcaliphilus]SEN49216.1 Subtilase family protein [Paracoccus alcaliphilus]
MSTTHRLCLMALLAGATILTGLPDPFPGPGGWQQAAWAGDDDDDDDDDDDGPRLRLRIPQVQRRAAPARAPAPVPPPPANAPELVVTDLGESDLQLLLDEGFGVIETLPLGSISSTLHRLSAPSGQSLDAARDRVRQLPSGGNADLNHYYRTDQSVTTAAAPPGGAVECTHANCASYRLVGWPDQDQRRQSCPIGQPIGVVDTGVNTEHELLEGARIELTHLGTEDNPSAKIHGTAVLSLLAGTPGSRVSGLVPEAELVVADIFSLAGQDERADLSALLRGLDAMDQRDIRVVNLSLTGPANTVLENAVSRLVQDRGMVLIAAAGNDGPAAPTAYPAGYDGVIAVTAVDGRGRIYRDAQRGAHIDIAAPGVGLLLATSISGARTKTGTSFATPYVTAAAAMLLSRDPELTAQDIARRLSEATRDLGAEGRDEVYGHGLLMADELCREG